MIKLQESTVLCFISVPIFYMKIKVGFILKKIIKLGKPYEEGLRSEERRKGTKG